MIYRNCKVQGVAGAKAERIMLQIASGPVIVGRDRQEDDKRFPDDILEERFRLPANAGGKHALSTAEQMNIDFGRAATDYARFRAGFPDRFFERLFSSGFVKPGDRVLDLGTGTGTVARGLTKRGCTVTGLDQSGPLLEQSRILDREAGVEIRYVSAKAENTGLGTVQFDAVTAGQCWHWFDRHLATLEARRLLRPDGRLVIAHFDWLPLPGNVVEATENLIRDHNSAWDAYGGTGIHPLWYADLAQGGFLDIESFTFDVSVPYSREAWLGRIRASAGVGASLPADRVERFNAAHRDMLARNFPCGPLQIPHRVFAVSGRSALVDSLYQF